MKLLGIEGESAADIESNRRLEAFSRSPEVHLIADPVNTVVEELGASVVVRRPLGQHVGCVRPLAHQRAQVANVLQKLSLDTIGYENVLLDVRSVPTQS